MHLLLFDQNIRESFLPLSFTRPVSHLRFGILSIHEKWAEWIDDCTITPLTIPYLQEKYPPTFDKKAPNYFVHAGLLPDAPLVKALRKLKPNEALTRNGQLLAACTVPEKAVSFTPARALKQCKHIAYTGETFQLRHIWELFTNNGWALEADYELLTRRRKSAAVPSSNYTKGEKIFIEPGATVEAAILNCTEGPIYIGKNATIMEGAMLRGPVALCAHAQVKMGAKVYGPTTIGPYSKAGGELNNVVITGYSNKAHDGFLGNSVLGEWCNIGADTNNSNLKNNYGNIRLWDYRTGKFEDTGLQFCGLIMADHSKCGINTMFNTGTVIGVSSNIYGAGFPRNFIPSFSWGGPNRITTYQTDKAYEGATRVMERRSKKLSATDKKILKTIFYFSSKFRHWEKNKKNEGL